MEAGDDESHVVCGDIGEPVGENIPVLMCPLDVLEDEDTCGDVLILLDFEQFIPEDDDEEVFHLFWGFEIGFKIDFVL